MKTAQEWNQEFLRRGIRAPLPPVLLEMFREIISNSFMDVIPIGGKLARLEEKIEGSELSLMHVIEELGEIRKTLYPITEVVLKEMKIFMENNEEAGR